MAPKLRSVSSGVSAHLNQHLLIHVDQRKPSKETGDAVDFWFVHTPIHASWMNQVEIWFSILHRRIIKYGDFVSAAEQAQRVHGLIEHWNLVERHRSAGLGEPTSYRLISVWPHSGRR